MSDYQRTILNHYDLPTLFPVEWPSAKDESDDPDDDAAPQTKSTADLRLKPKYSALDHVGNPRRGSYFGFDRSSDAVGSQAQKDEPDPLGSGVGIVRALRQQGLPVDENAQLRNRFLLSSTTFSPPLFLSQLHSNDSTQALLQGLDYLSRSIDQKSASLKSLVESNFDRFVRAKATIDNVYSEMRNQGANSDLEKKKLHSRQASRSSQHLRTGSSGGFNPVRGSTKSLPGNKRRNALVEDTEFGVQGIKSSLVEVSAKAKELWGPVMGGVERGEGIKAVLSAVEKYRGIYELPGTIAECMKRRDYETLVEEYGRARHEAEEARHVANSVVEGRKPLTSSQIHQIIVTTYMWVTVEELVEDFKRDIWRRLVLNHAANSSPGTAFGDSEEHMELMRVLLELGVQDNPIWVWLLSRYDYLKSRISATSERFRVEVEYLRRRLVSGPKPSAQTLAAQLRSALYQGTPNQVSNLDAAPTIDLWEGMFVSLEALLGRRGGILSEVIDFWETAQSFIDGKAQRTLPVGFDGESRKHHRLSIEGVADLQNGIIELVNLIRDAVSAFFIDSPPEDLSLLFAPASASPDTPPSPNSGPLYQSVFKDIRYNLKPSGLPQPSPMLDEPWERFAFWPPHSNSLSGVHYLGKMLVLVGTAASDMAAIKPIGQAVTTVERLRSLVSGARERCVQATCAAWNRDAENCKFLEDWTRSSNRRDRTNMPTHFAAFASTVLSGMQKILYISEAMTRNEASDVVSPPPAKLLQMVRGQFVTSLYKSLSGMAENAESAVATEDDDGWGGIADVLTTPATDLTAVSLLASSADATNREVRLLLTLSNLQALRTEAISALVSQFENSFSVKLSDEASTIRDVVRSIDARLFSSYTDPAVAKLSRIIRAGILSPGWEPSGATGKKPTEVPPYVYEVLLTLVLMHTQVQTTAAPLTPHVLSYLLEQVSRELLDTFRQRPRYSLLGLMQATLDIEMLSQTLTLYTTDKASDIQRQIYQELDKVTDSETRQRLQSELPEMRNTLKMLREKSKAEFACFRKPKVHKDRHDKRTGTSSASSTTSSGSTSTVR